MFASAGDFNIDLLLVGLCSARKLAGNDTLVLDEGLGREAILELVQKHITTAKAFQTIACLCAPALGHAMEPLLVAELRAWSGRNKDATVKSFLSKLFTEIPNNMPR